MAAGAFGGVAGIVAAVGGAASTGGRGVAVGGDAAAQPGGVFGNQLGRAGFRRGWWWRAPAMVSFMSRKCMLSQMERSMKTTKRTTVTVVKTSPVLVPKAEVRSRRRNPEGTCEAAAATALHEDDEGEKDGDDDEGGG